MNGKCVQKFRFRVLKVAVFICYSSMKNKALSVLNTRKPQYPPDVYYIRRNPNVLQNYLKNRNTLDHMYTENDCDEQ